MITTYEERRQETRRRCLVYSIPRLEPSWTSGYKGSNRDTFLNIVGAFSNQKEPYITLFARLLCTSISSCVYLSPIPEEKVSCGLRDSPIGIY